MGDELDKLPSLGKDSSGKEFTYEYMDILEIARDSASIIASDWYNELKEVREELRIALLDAVTERESASKTRKAKALARNERLGREADALAAELKRKAAALKDVPWDE